MKVRLAVDALEMVAVRRGGDAAGCVTHSDRGSPGVSNCCDGYTNIAVTTGEKIVEG